MNIKTEYLMQTYQDLGAFDEKGTIRLKRNVIYGTICLEKRVSIKQEDIYLFLKENEVPGVPIIFECFSDQGSLVIIEEYIQGRTLEDLIHERQLSDDEIADIILQLCDCLEVLHNAEPQIICRDLKAENIVIDANGKVWLVDFDIARTFQAGKKRDTVVLGTAEYAAPEQFGFFQTDNRTDIYSMGILINYMATNKFPVEQMVTGSLETIVRNCTQLEPALRYQRIEELRSELNSIVAARRHNEIERKKIYLDSFISLIKKSYKSLIACAVLLWLCYTMDIESTQITLTDWMVRVEQTIIYITQLAFIGIVSDFKGCRKKIPIVRSAKKHIRIIGYIFVEVIMFVVSGIVCGIFEGIFY